MIILQLQGTPVAVVRIEGSGTHVTVPYVRIAVLVALDILGSTVK